MLPRVYVQALFDGLWGALCVSVVVLLNNQATNTLTHKKECGLTFFGITRHEHSYAARPLSENQVKTPTILTGSEGGN
jgi:hypothetical protein